ncbi:MAG: phosphoglycerate dehydrogenase [Gemmatimonadota bacterium]|nr:phosphoglycerate dehydrogenase [Gemmatimonadota bacterium]
MNAATPHTAATPFRILVADGISASGLEPLTRDERFQVVRVSTPDQLLSELPTAHGLLVRSKTRVDAELLQHALVLEVIGRAGVGVDNIDLEAATARGIPVLNAPAGNTISAAELTMALMLGLARGVPAADQALRSGTWSKTQGVELRGKTLGLVGAGRIGGEVARRCLAFGMRVLAYDPYLSAQRAEELNLEAADLDTVLGEADVISLHVPLTESTRGLIDAARLKALKPGVLLINVARGGVVDEDALAEALHAGTIAGAALDVYEHEPLQEGSPLRGAPNLVLTPHLGASTAEAQELVALEIADAVRLALLEGDLTRAVNAPAVGGETLRRLRPLLELGQRLGRVACALADGAMRRVEVRYAGASTEALRPLSQAVLAGVLQNVLGRDQVNFVNAGHLASGRGIDVSRSRTAARSDYAEFLEVVLETASEELRIGGTVLGEGHSRIVRIGPYRVDVRPTGTLLILKNQDVPGVIGKVGTLLGTLGVNIAEYHQARLAQGGDALAAVSVDGSVGRDTLQRLLEMPEITEARMVVLD